MTIAIVNELLITANDLMEAVGGQNSFPDLGRLP